MAIIHDMPASDILGGLDGWLTLSIVLGTAFGLIIFHYLSNLFRPGLRGVPGPFWAHLSSFYRVKIVWNGRAVINYRALHGKYGSIVRTGSNHVSVSEPSVISLVFGVTSKFRKAPFFKLSTPYYEGEKLESMFTVQDPIAHGDLRAPTAHVYSLTNTGSYEQHIDECTDLLFGVMRDVEGRDDVNYTHFFAWYTFDVITAISYQERFGFLEARSDVGRWIEGVDVQSAYLAYVGQFPQLHRWLYGNRFFVKALTYLMPDLPDPLADIHALSATESCCHNIKLTLTQKIGIEIDRYNTEDRQPDRKDFLTQLRAKDDPNRKDLRRDLVNHLSNNVLAGSDTTSNALRAIFYYLSRYPEVYKKVQTEIDQAEAKGQFSKFVTYDESLKLEYLQAVIREAMRVHPSICYPLERVVLSGGADVLGHHIPGGTVIDMMAPLLNTARTAYGPDADEFRPERWLEADPEQLRFMDRAYFTFGHGSRGCIGKSIALMEISKCVPQCLRYFEIEWVGGPGPWKLHSRWFYRGELRLKFTARPHMTWIPEYLGNPTWQGKTIYGAGG